MIITKSNYFDWTANHLLPADEDIQQGDKLIRVLTKKDKGWSAVDADPMYTELVSNHLALLNRLLKAKSVKQSAKGKKKKLSADSKAAFAERMRQAREAKKGATDRRPTKESAVKEPAAAADRKRPSAKTPSSTKENTVKPPKSPKTSEPVMPKPNQQDQAYLAAKHVKVPSVELKHIKRFVLLAGEGTKDKIVSALEQLQREIKKGILSKKSPFAAELDEIQDTYLGILNAGKAPYKVSLSADTLAKYVGMAGGEKVYKSVEILLKFIGWTEAQKSEEQIKKLLSEIRNARAKDKIKPSDPYADEIDALASMLAKAGSGKKFDATKVDLQGIAGLGSLAELGCACRDTVSGLGSMPAPVKGGIMSATDMMSFSYPTYDFERTWGQLLGHPQTNAKVMIWGEPGQGKSTLAYQLARYLASSFGTVLYVAQEEINQAGQASMTVQTKLKAVGGAVDGWRFTGDLAKIDGNDKFVIIDSVNSSGLTEEAFAALLKKYPGVFFILVFQATKEGKFKGAKDWEHLVDVVVKVEAGKASTTKNRFAPLSTVTIF